MVLGFRKREHVEDIFLNLSLFSVISIFKINCVLKVGLASEGSFERDLLHSKDVILFQELNKYFPMEWYSLLF